MTDSAFSSVEHSARQSSDGTIFLSLTAVLVLAPLLLPSLNVGIPLLTEIVIFALFAVAFNILLGGMGLASFGHAAFFGGGAYAVAILQDRGFDNIALGLIMAALVGAIFAGMVGVFVMKKRGIYFGLLTLAFGQIFYIVAMRWDEFTGGETGLTGVRRGLVGIGELQLNLEDPVTFYYVAAAICLLCIYFIRVILQSPFGAVLSAIKGNEVRAQYLGYNIALYKLAAMVISGCFSGIAGGLYGLLQHAAYPQYLFWVDSGNVVVATLIGGGTGNFFGAILGATIFVGAHDLIMRVTEHWMLVFGLVFIVIVSVFPKGLPEAFSRLWRRIKPAHQSGERK